jgi:hypothetical protein
LCAGLWQTQSCHQQASEENQSILFHGQTSSVDASQDRRAGLACQSRLCREIGYLHWPGRRLSGVTGDVPTSLAPAFPQPAKTESRRRARLCSAARFCHDRRE